MQICQTAQSCVSILYHVVEQKSNIVVGGVVAGKLQHDGQRDDQMTRTWSTRQLNQTMHRFSHVCAVSVNAVVHHKLCC